MIVILQPGADPLLCDVPECRATLVWDDDNEKFICVVCSKRCRDCGKHCGTYMLKDEIWRSIWPSYAEDMRAIENEKLRHCNLCFGCAEKRLGRRFRFDDFMDLPANDVVFHFLKDS